jgi:hypothetical protein
LIALASFTDAMPATAETDTRDLRAALDRREPLPHRSEDHREIVAGYDLDVASSYGGT